MARDKAKKARTETIRQRAGKSLPHDKPRRLRKTAHAASTPFRFIGVWLGRLLKPFRFLLWPFKTKPARFIGRILASIFFLRYFRDSWRELRQVTWPNRKETWQLTFAVFMFAIIFGLMVSITDYGLDKVFKRVLLR